MQIWIKASRNTQIDYYFYNQYGWRAILFLISFRGCCTPQTNQDVDAVFPLVYMDRFNVHIIIYTVLIEKHVYVCEWREGGHHLFCQATAWLGSQSFFSTVYILNWIFQHYIFLLYISLEFIKCNTALLFPFISLFPCSLSLSMSTGKSCFFFMSPRHSFYLNLVFNCNLCNLAH